MNCLGSEDRLAKNLDGNRSKDVPKTDGLSDVRSLGGQDIFVTMRLMLHSFFYKNSLYKNHKAQSCKNLRIFLRILLSLRSCDYFFLQLEFFIFPFVSMKMKLTL